MSHHAQGSWVSAIDERYKKCNVHAPNDKERRRDTLRAHASTAAAKALEAYLGSAVPVTEDVVE